MALSISVVRGFDEPAAADLRETWAELSASSPLASVFSTYEWCRAWAETVGTAWRPEILIFRESGPTQTGPARDQGARCCETVGRAVGLLPGGCRTGSFARWLTFLGRDRVSGDHLDLLCAPGRHEQCVEALSAHLGGRVNHGRPPPRATPIGQGGPTPQTTAVGHRKPAAQSVPRPPRGGRARTARGGIDGVFLGEIDLSSPTRTGLVGWARRCGLPCAEREPQVLPYVPLPNSWEGYVASLKESMRADIRRSQRNLEAVPGGTIRVVCDPVGVAEALEHLFRLHRMRWQREGQGGNFRDPAKCAFLRRFCNEAARLGWVRAYLLEGAGEVHGALLAFHWRGTAYSYQLGWNPAGPFRSPGILLNGASIAQAIREGVERYDFLRGNEPHKRRWTEHFSEATTLVIGCRLPARATMAVWGFAERVKALGQRALGPRAWERLKAIAAGRGVGPPWPMKAAARPSPGPAPCRSGPVPDGARHAPGKDTRAKSRVSKGCACSSGVAR